jgi:excinuclease UvrABC ATPase subunit
MKRKYPKCEICGGDGVITREAGTDSEYYEPCPVCNPPKEEDPDSYRDNLEDR